MTIFQLRYFVALAELKNFSKVAERFFVAQSAVSYHIHTLEEELGIRLFMRTTRSVRLTAAGLAFSRRMRPLLAELDAAVEEVKQNPNRDRFVIACSRLCNGKTYARIVAQLQKMEPNADVITEYLEPEEDALELLADGQIDASLFFNPAMELGEKIAAKIYPSYGKTRTLIVSEDNAFASRESVDSDEFDEKDLLACEIMRRNEQRLSYNSGLVDSDVLLNDIGSMFIMAKEGRGMAAVPVIDDVGVSGLRYIPINEKEVKDSGIVLTLAWNRNNESPYMQSLLRVADFYLGNGETGTSAE